MNVARTAEAPPIHRLFDRFFGIPRLTPAAAGLFRLLLGGLLTWLIWNTTAIGYSAGSPVPLAPGAGYGAGTWDLSHWIRSHPDVHLALYRVTLGAAIAFTLGALTRVAAMVVWAGVLLLIAVSLTTSGNHTWLAPWLALIGLPLTPLGDGLSLDALWRRWRGHPTAGAPSAAYGFAMWWIGLILGLAFLAAAFAKVYASGLGWATGGAVRYHFVEDASHAPVSWGIWVAGQPALAVAFSTIGLLVEATLILVIFFRRDVWRAAFGVAFASMHGLFFLFQGVLWTPWITLAVAFLPWGAVSKRMAVRSGGADAVPRRLGVPHLAALVAVVALQVFASVQRFEYEPLLSHYPMYSGTYASWEAFFNSKRWTKYQTYRFFARDVGGGRTELTAPSEWLSPLDVDHLIETLQAAHQGDEIPEPSMQAVAALSERLHARFGGAADRLEVDVAVRRINFAERRVDEPATGLHAFTLRLSPPSLEFVAPEFASLGRTMIANVD